MNTAFQEAVDAVKGEPVTPNEEQEAEAPQEEVELDLSDDTGEEVDKEEILAVERPQSWSSSNSEQWNELTPTAQQAYADRERNLQSDYSKRQDKIAEDIKAFEAEKSSFNDQKAKDLENMKVFGPQAPNKDMLNPEHESYDTDAYHLQKAQFEDHQNEMSKVEDEITLESAEKRKEWQMNEIEVYKKVLPEFVDTEKGPAFRQKLAEYATKALGITMEQAAKQFPITPANDMKILYQSMLYENAVAKQKKGKQAPKSKSLAPGNNNPGKAEKPNQSKAVANWNKDRSPAAAAALFSGGKK